MASPVFFIKKKDGALRLMQDYRMLNAMTVKNKYPLPLIPELIAKLGGAKYFTKLDVRWGFNNVRMKEGDEWKAAFRTNCGLFEPLVMFFGLTNSPATFQTMMDDIFEELITDGIVVVYLDDILIFMETIEEHRKITRRVLELLEKNKLYLQPDKCEFERTTIEYLGVIISHNSIAMDPVKVAGVAEWPELTNKKEVQSFLGFTNFYRCFIQDFSQHTRPLFDLTKKDEKWHWGADKQSAFNGLKRNYMIHDKEMLAIVRSLQEWRHFLEGAEHQVEIWTDHKNLEYFASAKQLNRRQARWSLYLTRFDYQLHHRPGKSMGKPDTLSRRADHGTGAGDNSNIVLLAPTVFAARALEGLEFAGPELDILRDIRKGVGAPMDEPIAEAARQLRKASN